MNTNNPSKYLRVHEGNWMDKIHKSMNPYHTIDLRPTNCTSFTDSRLLNSFTVLVSFRCLFYAWLR